MVTIKRDKYFEYSFQCAGKRYRAGKFLTKSDAEKAERARRAAIMADAAVTTKQEPKKSW